MKAFSCCYDHGMIATRSASGIATGCKTDAFNAKGGKEVVITAIKHASLHIQHGGHAANVRRWITSKTGQCLRRFVA